MAHVGCPSSRPWDALIGRPGQRCTLCCCCCLDIAWILLLFEPPNVSADKHISIVLRPKGYMDPRTLDNFTCGINTVTDSGRLLAEQNTNYIFETFLNNKENDSKYQTKVFDVLTFSKDGTAEEMIKNQLYTPTWRSLTSTLSFSALQRHSVT